jgi:hypothetical protein
MSAVTRPVVFGFKTLGITKLCCATNCHHRRFSKTLRARLSGFRRWHPAGGLAEKFMLILLVYVDRMTRLPTPSSRPMRITRQRPQ